MGECPTLRDAVVVGGAMVQALLVAKPMTLPLVLTGLMEDATPRTQTNLSLDVTLGKNSIKSIYDGHMANRLRA